MSVRKAFRCSMNAALKSGLARSRLLDSRVREIDKARTRK